MMYIKNYLVNDLAYPAEDALIMVFLICTPILLVISWILELVVDRPAKEFAGEFDRQIRRKRPRPMATKNEDGALIVPTVEEFYSFSEFSKRIWPIYAFIAWLLFVFVSIEIFAANHTYKNP
jgi:peptidoglycan/LPS O-acetylase OafA/YrhL